VAGACHASTGALDLEHLKVSPSRGRNYNRYGEQGVEDTAELGKIQQAKQFLLCAVQNEDAEFPEKKITTIYLNTFT
jgi:hypothetical protein